MPEVGLEALDEVMKKGPSRFPSLNCWSSPLEWISQRWPHSQASFNLSLERSHHYFWGSLANLLLSPWGSMAHASCCLSSSLQQVLVDKTALLSIHAHTAHI